MSGRCQKPSFLPHFTRLWSAVVERRGEQVIGHNLRGVMEQFVGSELFLKRLTPCQS